MFVNCGDRAGKKITTPAVVLISEVILPLTANFTFDNIPQTYRDIGIFFRGRGDLAASNTENLVINFNDDAGSNYNWQELHGIGATAGSSQSTSTTSLTFGVIPGATAPTSYSGFSSVRIANYTGLDLFKSSLGDSGVSYGTGAGLNARYVIMGLWRSLNPITKAKLSASSGNMLAGAVVSLYGYL